MIDYAMPRNKYSDGLSKHLAKSYDYRIMIDQNTDTGFAPSYQVVPILYNGGKGKIGAMISYGKSVLSVAADIRKNNYDVVHIQTFKNATVEMKLYALLHRYIGKLVHTVHNVLPHEVNAADQEKYKSFYNECDALIVHNEYSKSLLIEYFDINPSKITVIPRGIYEDKGAVIEKKGKDIAEFLLFGKIRKYKGIDILLKAISLIPEEQRKSMHFTIAGQQYAALDDTDYKEMIHELGIQEYVSFISDRITDVEKDRMFYLADACVCPYTVIYGSGVLLEAYTHVCPVICSDIPVFIEDTENGKTGSLFKTADANDLARALIEFTNQKEEVYAEYRRKINDLIGKKYNWEIAAKKTEAVYDCCM